MKKTILLLVVLLTSSLAFVSCSKDNNEPVYGDDPIVGEWTMSYEDEEGTIVATMTFNADGTGKSTVAENGGVAVETGVFTYVHDRAAKTLKIDGTDEDGKEQKITFVNVSVSNTTLSITFDGNVSVFTRK